MKEWSIKFIVCRTFKNSSIFISGAWTRMAFGWERNTCSVNGRSSRSAYWILFLSFPLLMFVRHQSWRSGWAWDAASRLHWGCADTLTPVILCGSFVSRLFGCSDFSTTKIILRHIIILCSINWFTAVSYLEVLHCQNYYASDCQIIFFCVCV